MTVFGRQMTTTSSSLLMCVTISMIPCVSGWTPSSCTSFAKLIVYFFAGKRAPLI